jgi:hypothetical protein
MWAAFLMVFFLVVGCLHSASMVDIGASNFDGFNDTFCHVAATDPRRGAEVALLGEFLMARRTYGMPHSALRYKHESVNMRIT